MFKINSLPKSIRIEPGEPQFASAMTTLKLMDSLASSPDRSTVAIVPAAVFAALFEPEHETNVTVVKLPDSAEPYVEQLLWARPGYMTCGRHLGERHLCLAFEPIDVDAAVYLDVHKQVETLMRVERGDAHLVLVIACGQTLYFRLLNAVLRLDDAEEGESEMHYPLFSADNYKPGRENSEEELIASFNECTARYELPYDPSLLAFRPAPLWIEYEWRT